MSRARVASAALFAAALLAGCGSGDDGGSDTASGSSAVSSAPSSSSSASASATATGGSERPDDGSTDAPAFPANTEPDTEEASADAQVTVSDIRTGRHGGFDRVVFEVGGTGTPGWDVRYVDQASSQGSGDPIDVAGDAVLQVTLTGAQIPDTTGVAEYDGPNPLAGAGTQTVTEVAYDHIFEGTAVAFVGTTAEVPFRVYALSNPARVVVEVRDS
ncbi:AMIN-like domain-containing (lipo)protein [Geodermatophilus sp. URMC 64]